MFAHLIAMSFWTTSPYELDTSAMVTSFWVRFNKHFWNMVSVTRIMLRLRNIIMNKMYFLLSKAANLVEKLTNIFLFQKKITIQDYHMDNTGLSQDGHRIWKEQCGLIYLERHKDRIRQSIKVWWVLQKGETEWDKTYVPWKNSKCSKQANMIGMKLGLEEE